MSYLDLPRINFSGRWFTNVSTINNQLTNYPPNAPIDGGWEPDGVAEFRFDNATVTGVQAGGDDGALVGATVETPGNFNGKMVDIDPQFQQLTQLIGVNVSVATASGAGFSGTLEPCNFQDIWFPQKKTRGNAGASNGSAAFISVLHSVQWTKAEEVPALHLLRETSTDSKLAIRFLIGSFFHSPTPHPDSGYGQLIGTIAPHMPDDPTQFVRRRLMPPSAVEAGHQPRHGEDLAASAHGRESEGPGQASDVSSALQAGNFHLDKQAGRLSIDLANSVPIESFGGPPKDIGDMRAVVVGEGGTSDPIEPTFRFTPESYKEQGGIIDLEPTAAQCASLAGQQMAIELQSAQADPWTTVLTEHPEGKYVNISPFTARAVGGATTTFELQAFQWGEPLSGETLEVTAKAPSGSSIAINGGTGSAVTGPDGLAAFIVNTPSALEIPRLRKELDSIAYSVSGPWIAYIGGQNTNQMPVACLLVWAPYADAGIPDPTWDGQVQPIFDEYMRMYPGMKQKLDLADRATVTVVANAEKILRVFSLPFDHPHTMPVTRDLSPQKIEVIKTWLKNQIDEANNT